MKKEKPFEMPIAFWLMTIEDEKIREKALRNSVKGSCQEVIVTTASGAVMDAFTWCRTKEGHIFWEAIYDDLKGKGL